MVNSSGSFKKLNCAYSPGTFNVGIKRSEQNNFLVSLKSEHPGLPILFTKDGEDPNTLSRIFKKDFSIKKTTTIKAVVLRSDNSLGPVSQKTFYHHKAMGKSVLYKKKYEERYSGSGEKTLIDGLIGSEKHNDGYWKGWEKENMEIVIDLYENRKINTIICGFLESHQSWIFLPKSITVSFSSDGKSFTNKKQILLKDGENYGNSNRKEAVFNNLNQSARYVLVKAFNRRKCPDWHAGAGGNSWVFSDEVVVQ